MLPTCCIRLKPLLGSRFLFGQNILAKVSFNLHTKAPLFFPIFVYVLLPFSFNVGAFNSWFRYYLHLHNKVLTMQHEANDVKRGKNIRKEPNKHPKVI